MILNAQTKATVDFDFAWLKRISEDINRIADSEDKFFNKPKSFIKVKIAQVIKDTEKAKFIEFPVRRGNGSTKSLSSWVPNSVLGECSGSEIEIEEWFLRKLAKEKNFTTRFLNLKLFNNNIML